MTSDSVMLPPAVLVAVERLATTLAGAEPIAAYRQAKKRLEADGDAGKLVVTVTFFEQAAPLMSGTGL